MINIYPGSFEDSELKSFSELHPMNFLWHKTECDQTGKDRKLEQRINGGRFSQGSEWRKLVRWQIGRKRVMTSSRLDRILWYCGKLMSLWIVV